MPKCGHCGSLVRRKYFPADGKCRSCGKKFVFTQAEGDRLSDGFFLACINRVSSQGQIRWMRDHLYYELRRGRRKIPAKAGCMLGFFTIWGTMMVGGIGAIVMQELGAPHLSSLPIIVLLIGIPVVGYWIMRRRTSFNRMTPAEFDAVWKRWTKENGIPEGMLKKPGKSGNGGSAPDLDKYSFDRVVICERSEIAACLLANNFHIDNGCAVLGVDRYPAASFDKIREMLRGNPDVKVFVIHDASARGCALPEQICRDRDWFPEATEIFDVGLRPTQCKALKACYLPASGAAPPAVDCPTYSEAELKWLGSHSVPLEAVPADKLMRALAGGFSKLAAGDRDLADDDLAAGGAFLFGADDFG
jgi:hypothetical protein